MAYMMKGTIILGAGSHLDEGTTPKDEHKEEPKELQDVDTNIDPVKEGASGAKINGIGNSVKSSTGKIIDTTPSINHTTVTKNPGLKGEPNSSVDIMGKDGKSSTRRWYDQNGNQMRDVDMTNHGNSGKHPEVPHEHGSK